MKREVRRTCFIPVFGVASPPIQNIKLVLVGVSPQLSCSGLMLDDSVVIFVSETAVFFFFFPCLLVPPVPFSIICKVRDN